MTKLARENQAVDPVNAEHHSLLTINRNRKLYHVEVDKVTGEYCTAPEELSRPSEGFRKVFNIAGEAPPELGASPEGVSRVAVGLLPIKDEPNSAFICCYLMNAPRLNVTNTWTVAEWSDQEEVRVRMDVPDKSPSRLLVATAQGVVYDLTIDASTPKLDLQENPEVWRLLRNGCLAGEALTDDGIAPLINLASFTGGLEQKKLEVDQLVAGTWDFKWPRDKVLRVAFAPISKYQPEAQIFVKQRVQDLAHQWTVNTCLGLEFSDFDGVSEYDILIDLNDLADTEVPGGRGRSPRKIGLPMSELGSYASRATFGNPTMYLGKPPGLKDENGAEIVDYFGSKAFAHIVLHELGHALGLPHLHQHPKLDDPFKDPQAVKQILKADLGVDMSPAEILEELSLRWPGPLTYSDWIDIGGRTGPELSELSVMMGLPARHIYRSQSKGPAVKYSNVLLPLDKEWIQKLYPR